MQIAARNWNADENDTRTVVDLMVDQIEFANIVLVNKIDLVTEEQLGIIEGIIRHLNPDCTIHRTEFSNADLKDVLFTHKFDLNRGTMESYVLHFLTIYLYSSDRRWLD